MAPVRREMWRFSDGPLTRPFMNPHSAIPVLTVMNFHHGLLARASAKKPYRKRACKSLCYRSRLSRFTSAKKNCFFETESRSVLERKQLAALRCPAG